MGKEGLHLILHAFNEEGVMQDDASQAADYYLKNYHFIYWDPDDDQVCFFAPYLFEFVLTVCTYVSDQGNKGAFLSPLVCACLAVHLKKTMHNVKQYGYPVGALAIATAVVRCLHCNPH